MLVAYFGAILLLMLGLLDDVNEKLPCYWFSSAEFLQAKNVRLNWSHHLALLQQVVCYKDD